MHWQSLLAEPLKSHYREISDEHNAEPEPDGLPASSDE